MARDYEATQAGSAISNGSKYGSYAKDTFSTSSEKKLSRYSATPSSFYMQSSASNRKYSSTYNNPAINNYSISSRTSRYSSEPKSNCNSSYFSRSESVRPFTRSSSRYNDSSLSMTLNNSGHYDNGSNAPSTGRRRSILSKTETIDVEKPATRKYAPSSSGFSSSSRCPSNTSISSNRYPRAGDIEVEIAGIHSRKKQSTTRNYVSTGTSTQNEPKRKESLTNGYSSVRNKYDLPPSTGGSSRRPSLTNGKCALGGASSERTKAPSPGLYSPRERKYSNKENEAPPNVEMQRQSKSIDSGDENGMKNGLVGLRNLGNTCYFSSIVQCLSNTNDLRVYLLDENIYTSDIVKRRGNLVKSFANVLKQLWRGDKPSFSPNDLLSSFTTYAPRFKGFFQQDSQECLRYLLEGIHEDVNKAVKSKDRTPLGDIPDNWPHRKQAEEAWRRYLLNENSYIIDMFVGQLKSELKCTACNNVSVTFDPFWDLSLPIPNDSEFSFGSTTPVNISECLSLFTRDEVLDGDEKPTCSKCNARQRSIKSFKIEKFPKYLAIHLKRFSQGSKYSKLKTPVEFPYEKNDFLDLSTYASKDASVPQYRLYGVSNHIGGVSYGHYTAYCRSNGTTNWYEYDDCRVSPLSENESSLKSKICSASAYVLFFETAKLR